MKSISSKIRTIASHHKMASRSLKSVFSSITEEEARAVYEFLAQAVDNELYNDEEEWESKYLPLALDVVDKLESVLADLATNEKVSNSGFCRTK